MANENSTTDHRHGSRPRRQDHRKRNRGRDRNRSRDRDNRGGSQRADRNEYRPPRRDDRWGDSRRGQKAKPEASKPSLGRKILAVLTFGLLGRDKAKSPGKNGGPHGKGKGAVANPTARDKKSPVTATKTQPPRQTAPPNLDAITSTKLHVGNLSYDATESDLFELFRGVGKVTNAEIVTHQRTQRSKGFGFVFMGSVEEARRAVEILHGKPYMGRTLTVGPAKPERERDDRRSLAEAEAGAARES